MLQQEPHALNVVSGVHRAALSVVQPGRAVHVHVLQRAFQLRLYVVLENVVHALLRPLLIERFALRVGAQHHAGDVQDNHGRAEGPAAAGLRDGLGAHAHRVGLALAQVPVEVVAFPRPLQTRFLPGHAVVFRVGDGAERLGEVVPPLAQRLALCGDGEVHPVPGLMVEAVGFHEIQAAPAGLQPLLLHTVGMTQECVNPAAAALHPYALVRGIDFALPVQAGVDPAVLLVHAVGQPEAGRTLQLFPHPGLGVHQFLSVHRFFLSSFPAAGGWTGEFSVSYHLYGNFSIAAEFFEKIFICW